MSEPGLLFTVEEGIATLAFNRPDCLNTVNVEVLDLLGPALETIDRDRSIRVTILTGTGTRAFTPASTWRSCRRTPTPSAASSSANSRRCTCASRGCACP